MPVFCPACIWKHEVFQKNMETQRSINVTANPRPFIGIGNVEQLRPKRLWFFSCALVSLLGVVQSHLHNQHLTPVFRISNLTCASQLLAWSYSWNRARAARNPNDKAVILENLYRGVYADNGFIRHTTMMRMRELKYILVQLAICLLAFLLQVPWNSLIYVLTFFVAFSCVVPHPLEL